jgi:hypothetical protein
LVIVIIRFVHIALAGDTADAVLFHCDRRLPRLGPDNQTQKS